MWFYFEIDFGGYFFMMDGIEQNMYDNLFGVVMFFIGVLKDVVVEYVLVEVWFELMDVVVVFDVLCFFVDFWWVVQCDFVVGGGVDECELQCFVQVMQQIDVYYIWIDYFNGWLLDKG